MPTLKEIKGKQRINAMYELAFMLSKHMEEHDSRELGYSPLRALGSVAQRAAGILEGGYPGYREYGMVGLILRSKPARQGTRQSFPEGDM